ncbi:hypothetical protein PoB_003148800 [Plakobranchus ocellatus]|uniref:Uncharacterized protein n=1 Tax=Plakobranchus ocellatus TaxID=259542 RepID=A0AAV4ADV5_9GAST|nr:hypothetical protein PoB_003148800 [Plakobranchus ocellatus]
MVGPLERPSSLQPTTRCSKYLWPSWYVSPQQGDLRLSGPPSGQDARGGARTRDRRIPADLRASSLAFEPPTPQKKKKNAGDDDNFFG